MSNANLIKNIRNIDNGFCKKCNKLKGNFGDESNFFCYNCQGYKLVDPIESQLIIQRNKERIREEFKKLSTKSDILYFLKLFLSIGETFFIDDLKEVLIGKNNPRKNKILKIDPSRIAITNIAVKWLLEDSNDKSDEIGPWNSSYCVNMMNLIKIWLDWNRKEKLSDRRYKLGFFISKGENVQFYYTQQYKFYLDSLEKFNILNSFEDIDEENIKRVRKLEKEYLKNQNELEKYVKDGYPVIISTILNSYYTDEVIRPFSFDDLLDHNGMKLKELISNSPEKVGKFIVKKKNRYPELLLAFLETLYKYYYEDSFVSKKEIDKDGLVIIRDLNQLKMDIKRGMLLIPLFESEIITNPRNIHDYPFIVEYNGNFIISPSRIWIAYRLLHYALNQNRINTELAIKYENESMREIKSKLKSHGVKIIGEEIKKKKKGSFEIDLLGYYKNYILIIECKGFHPSPFFMLRSNRRYNDQFQKKIDKSKEIKKWIYENLKHGNIKNDKIEVNAYDEKRKSPIKLKFPKKFNNINKEKLIYLYITQIKEYFEMDDDNNVIQVWFGDL
ncbi:MAG: hypothetical protein GF311_00560 [Candidatus Lokiarchaeota archaeon]|nr:hypothetical protein [Candidatus Lokiarchaeota archaeon]